MEAVPIPKSERSEKPKPRSRTPGVRRTLRVPKKEPYDWLLIAGFTLLGGALGLILTMNN